MNLSNPVVRKTLVDTIVSYAKEHPQVDYLHFWLADDARNQCECDGCKDTTPSDFYVQILNEVDRRMTEDKLDTKIVFLIYFLEASQQGKGEIKPYIRNKNTIPTKVEDNIAYLQQWQKQYGGDSFVYDYHLLWDCNFDMGGYRSAEVLFQDMKNLERFGLNGMVSCQMQRVAFPTALGMVGMACALWDKEKAFDSVEEEALKLWEQVVVLVNQLEASDPDIRNTWDVGFFLKIVGGAVKGEKRPGIDY